MRRRLLAAPLLAALALSAAPASAAAPKPQVVDPPNDANGTANAVGDQATPAGSQGYADVLSVLWQTTKSTKKVGRKTVTTVTGFTVTTTLSAPAVPPTGTTLVYRMLSSTPRCGFFGVAYYTTKGSDPTQPQSAIRDNCNGSDTRLTGIAMPVVSGNTIKWTVPLSKIPKDSGVKLGSKLSNLWFEVREIEDFKAGCVPDDGGTTGYGGACGLGAGALDNSPTTGTGTYTIK
jgi:hypothetical protein